MKVKFKNFKLPAGRGDIKKIKKFNKKFKIIDESYNANPLSMKSAIENMSYYKTKRKGRKFIFLGDMLDLGAKSKNLKLLIIVMLIKFLYMEIILKKLLAGCLQRKKVKLSRILKKPTIILKK